MNRWQQCERARELSKEVGLRKPHADRLRVALAFPNTYFVGMSNLGFQTVYKLFNAEADIVCERVFLPPKTELADQLASGTPLVTLESQTLVADFDVLAFSVSFEWDYTNVLTMLRLAGLPLRADARTHRHPLVVIGGAVTFVNPEPLALFADAIAAGEGVLVPSLLRAFEGASDRGDLLRRLAGERGFYIPSFYDVNYGSDGTIAGFVPGRRSAGGPQGRSSDHRGRRSASDDDFYARNGIRLAISRRGGPRLRQSVSLLLGGIRYLPVRAFPTARILELAERARPHCSARVSSRSRCVITLISRKSSPASRPWATRSARRRFVLTISRRPWFGFCAPAASGRSPSRRKQDRSAPPSD